MPYTIQLHSLSGCFSTPWGTDVKHARTMVDVHDELHYWADQHPHVGADRCDAHALVWKGTIDDVTDAYPDFELTMGPRGGIRRQPC